MGNVQNQQPQENNKRKESFKDFIARKWVYSPFSMRSEHLSLQKLGDAIFDYHFADQKDMARAKGWYKINYRTSRVEIAIKLMKCFVFLCRMAAVAILLLLILIIAVILH